jgi:ribosomal protein L24
MTTITIKINEKTKAGKAFLAMSETFFAGVEGIEIIKNSSKNKNSNEEEPYDPAFVKMVLKVSKSKNRTRVSSKNIWERI